MAPIFSKLATAAALAYHASSVLAIGTSSYQLTEHYNSTNFFDKFEFFVSDFESNNHMAIDPTHGFVDYLSRDDAADAGLITGKNQDIAIRVDSTHNNIRGRGSVRIESHSRYNDGLIIAHFTHFPKPVCGAWPAFWMYGPNWPAGGELDIYEKWNLSPTNSITAHTAGPDEVGVCTLDPSLNPATSNCWIAADGQWPNESCSVTETNGQWGNPDGGVYATEWTENALKVWSWPVTNIPQDITDGTPDPSTWGAPHFFLDENTCDVPRAFSDMRIVIDITFCGDAAGNEGLWGNDIKDQSKCYGKTGGQICRDYVNTHASEYKDVFWEIEDIKHYRLLEDNTPASSSSVVYSSTIVPSSSVASSSVVPSSSAASSGVSSSVVPSNSVAPSSSAASSGASSSVVPSSSVASSIASSSAIPSSSVASSSTLPSSSVISSSAIPSSSAVSSSIDSPVPSGTPYPVPSDSSSTCTTSTTADDYSASSSTSCTTTTTKVDYPASSSTSCTSTTTETNDYLGSSSATSCTETTTAKTTATTVPYPHWYSRNSTFSSHYYPATTKKGENCYTSTAPNGAVYTITYGASDDSYNKPTGVHSYPGSPYQSVNPVPVPAPYPPAAGSPAPYPPAPAPYPPAAPPAPYPPAPAPVKEYPHNGGEGSTPASTKGEYAAVAPTGAAGESKPVTVSAGVSVKGTGAFLVTVVAGFVGVASLIL